MKRLPFFSAVLLFGLAVLLTAGCAASRKVQAMRILGSCKFEVSGVSLDSAAINKSVLGGSEKPLGGFVPSPKTILLIQNISRGIIPDSLGTLYFSILATVKNPSEDTLWLRSASGTVEFDSITTVPVAYRDTATPLLPGSSPVELQSKLPIGKIMMKILATDTLHIQGDLEFSLSPDGEPIPFSVSFQKAILPEERTKILDTARTKIISTLTDLWTSTLKQ